MTIYPLLIAMFRNALVAKAAGGFEVAGAAGRLTMAFKEVENNGMVRPTF